MDFPINWFLTIGLRRWGLSEVFYGGGGRNQMCVFLNMDSGTEQIISMINRQMGRE